MDVDTTAVHGTWFRQIPAGADAHYEPPHPADNRWQRGPVIEALYFADSEETAWAEWYRFLAESGLPPQRALPRDLWRWEVSLASVADLTDDERLRRVSLPAPRPTRLQWPAFQAVGERLHRAGWVALISASAARIEGRTLCVFRPGRLVQGLRPNPPPTTVTETPVVPVGMRT